MNSRRGLRASRRRNGDRGYGLVAGRRRATAKAHAVEMEAFERNPRYMPTIDEKRCVACGLCVDVCFETAICLERPGLVPRIDPSRCVGCGACVDECPNEAISLDAASPGGCSGSGGAF